MINKPTHIIVRIEDIDFEICRLKGRLAAQLRNPLKIKLQGQLEAYLAVKMQNKVVVNDRKTL